MKASAGVSICLFSLFFFFFLAFSSCRVRGTHNLFSRIGHIKRHVLVDMFQNTGVWHRDMGCYGMDYNGIGGLLRLAGSSKVCKVVLSA